MHSYTGEIYKESSLRLKRKTYTKILEGEQVRKTIVKSTDKEKNASISETLQQYIKTLQFFDDSTDDYIYMYDLTLERVFLTDKIREKYPIPPAGNDGNDFSDWDNIVYPKDRNLMNHYRNLLISGEIKSFDIDYRILDRAGNKVWVRVKGSLREKEDTKTLLIVGRISEIGSGGKVDTLTGLCCTEKFMEDIKQNLKVYDGYLMVLGVDNFRNINITHGRVYGDSVLKRIANILDKHTRYPMEVYRLSGDCFAVNFIQKEKEDVEQFYYFIKKALKELCTVSAGVVSYKHVDTADNESIYLYAETALNQAKKEGKNKLVFFSADEYQKNVEQVEFLDEIKESIREGYKGFSLEYQPQINSRDCKICGVEALLRYDSPSRGRVSPVEFIPLLEQTRLICFVGEWVLKTAVSQCKKWRKHLPNLNMSVNLSYVQLQQDGITDMVLDALKEVELPGDALTLELTENIQLQNYHYFNKIFYIWKQNGIRISIDDFGTGYSSLSYLKRIEINEVKIDKCFVDHVQYNAYNFRLLSNMIELAHSVQIDVCCEGVETIEELIALQELHADILQGYFFAKPYTVEDFEQAYICAQSSAFKAREEKESNISMLESDESKELLENLRKEEIGNIVESMDEMIYVSDMETYELYYLNAVGRRMTGVYDYKGCKCYEVLQGKEKPCEFCTNGQLCKEKFLVWEMENEFLEKHFLLKDKLIPWKGKMARVEMAFDITEKEILSQSTQQRLNLKRTIVDSCAILASENYTEQAALNVLEIMGKFCKSDRAYILKPYEDDTLWNLSLEWCAQGKNSIKEKFPSNLEKILDNNKTKRVTALIVRHNKILGLIGVDNPKQEEDVEDFVKTMSYFIGYTMEKEEMQKKLTTMIDS